MTGRLIGPTCLGYILKRFLPNSSFPPSEGTAGTRSGISSRRILAVA